MSQIDLRKLSEKVESDPDPFNFNLLVTIMNNGRLDESNVYKDDKEFLCLLISHYESEEHYELCVEYIQRLKSIYGNNSFPESRNCFQE